MLEFQKQAVSDLLAEDGLAVLAGGMGVIQLLLTFIKIHATPEALVFLVGASQDEEQYIMRRLAQEPAGSAGSAAAAHFKVINNETSAQERAQTYLGGGVLSVTSRILIIDFLKDRVPIHLVSGFLVYHAHKVTETSTEAFLLRIFRQHNKTGFIKGFSESPEGFLGGFVKVEKVMKHLFVRKLHLWPRFHLVVSSSIEQHPCDVVELRVPMTEGMNMIQDAILDVMSICLQELRKSNPEMDLADFTVDNAMMKSFDIMMQDSLDPMMHRLSQKSKQLLSDLRVLRKLLNYLIQYDCVTFNNFLQTLVTSHVAVGQTATWLFTDSANVIFKVAKERVYRERRRDAANGPSPSSSGNQQTVIEPVLEENPKWRILLNIFDEIFTTQKSLGSQTKVLVLVSEERTANQLKEYIQHGVKFSLLRLLRSHISWKSDLPRISSNLMGLQSKDGTDSAMSLSVVQKSIAKSKGRKAYMSALESQKRKRKSGIILPTAQDKAEDIADYLMSICNPHRTSDQTEDDVDDEKSAVIDDASIHDSNIRDETTASDTANVEVAPTEWILENVEFRAYSSIKVQYDLLEELAPEFVVMYDPDPIFIRRLEVFRANRPGIPLRVYFVVYDKSVEEQWYLTLLRKERDAFEKLIREKSIMAVPVNQDGREVIEIAREDMLLNRINTRLAGGRIDIDSEAGKAPVVVVDVREFRSTLPALLHQRGINVVPVTLEVGDYVLTPNVCVERKSVADLFGSFASGRLYTQAEAMCKYYKTAILLIEFEQNKAFSLQAVTELQQDISISSISSKIVLLTLHFPRLRIIWSSSPFETVAIFEDIKRGQPQPSPEAAMGIGVDGPVVDETFFTSAYDILQRIPGITSKNARVVMRRFKNLKELSEAPMDRVVEAMGPAAANQLVDFMETDEKQRGKKQSRSSKKT